MSEERTLEKIQQEYLNACAHYGDLTYQADQTYEAMKALDNEWKKVKSAQPEQAVQS